MIRAFSMAPNAMKDAEMDPTNAKVELGLGFPLPGGLESRPKRMINREKRTWSTH